MTTVNAYAAQGPDTPLEKFEYELPDLKPDEVDITVESCGICHSDLSMLTNKWGMTRYPFVGGHEVSGKVRAVGEQVSNLKPGDQVGLGWHAGYCMTCDQCMDGHHNRCPQGQGTIIGRHGGFADTVRAKAPSIFNLPAGLTSKEIGPLFCGGITVFTPFYGYEVSPTDRVAVLGIGGLGHLAIKFAAAWGCHVTALTSPGKEDEAKQMGAHETLNSRDPETTKKAQGRFDLILSTINVGQNWSDYMAALRPGGRLHHVGAVLEPMGINGFDLIAGQKSMAGSPVGSPIAIRKMLEFADRHQIEPTTEHFPMEKINDAFEHLKSGKARYRIVLDN
jgi:uncharacterized zinc-type alcohol dehydrogenase-like protein